LGQFINLLVSLMVIGSTIWVFVDARKVGMSNPAGWAIGTFCLWLFVFPTYLYMRHQHVKQMEAMRSV